MNDQVKATGSCLCGSVKLETESASKNVGACHCSMCRKWVGGPFMAVDCGTDVKISGEQYLSTFSSSAWAERGFCNRCGSGLFYKLKESGQYMVTAGLLDIEAGLDFDHQVFIDEKPKYYCFSNATKDMTGAELFAMYGAE